MLKKIYEQYFKIQKIRLIESKLVDLETDFEKNEFKLFNQSSILNGFEGIMIKDPESYYECKRSTSWLKSKPVIEVSLEVINYEEGTEETRVN